MFLNSLFLNILLLLFLRESKGDLGRKVNIGEFPFMVCVYDKKWKHCICSGALVKETLVVTSASCSRYDGEWDYDIFQDGLDNYGVAGGVVDWTTIKEDMLVDIINYEVHCLFRQLDASHLIYDLGTIELKTPFKQKSIKPTRVIGDKGWYRMDWNDFVNRDTKCAMIGWKTGREQWKTGDKDMWYAEVVPKSSVACYLYHFPVKFKFSSIGMVCGKIVTEGACHMGFIGAILYCNHNVYGIRTGGSFDDQCSETSFYLFMEALDDLDLLMPEQRPKGYASTINLELKTISLIALILSFMT